MIRIEGPLWFTGACLLCGVLLLYLRGWRREHRQYLKRAQDYDAKAQRRHEEFMRRLNDYNSKAWRL